MKKPPNLLFILPNLFTVSSIFCGLYAILQATEGAASDRFYKAAVAILFAVLFDAADGRVARMTKTQSDFGVQLDSLADVISFGVAPAVLVYKWALLPFGWIGLVVAFIYATCGALRLARFNVMAASEKTPPKHFLGVPIPLAAATIVSLVLLHYKNGGVELTYQPLMLAVVLLLSILMVSNIRYRTFKKLKANKRSVAILMTLATLVVVTAWKTGLSLVLVAAFSGFIAFGILEETARLIRKIFSRRRTEEEEEEEETV